MSESRSNRTLVWAAVQRAVPMAAVLFAAYGIAWWTRLRLPIRSFGLFYGDPIEAMAWFGMVSLPVLAWVLWAPTARLALRLGLLLVLDVAGWGSLLHLERDGTFSVDLLGLYRAYPIVSGAVVVLLAIAAHLWRRRRRPAVSGRASAGTLWRRLGVTLPIVIGCLALVLAIALSFIWIEPFRPTVALAGG